MCNKFRWSKKDQNGPGWVWTRAKITKPTDGCRQAKQNKNAQKTIERLNSKFKTITSETISMKFLCRTFCSTMRFNTFPIGRSVRNSICQPQTQRTPLNQSMRTVLGTCCFKSRTRHLGTVNSGMLWKENVPLAAEWFFSSSIFGWLIALTSVFSKVTKRCSEYTRSMHSPWQKWR